MVSYRTIWYFVDLFFRYCRKIRQLTNVFLFAIKEGIILFYISREFIILIPVDIYVFLERIYSVCQKHAQSYIDIKNEPACDYCGIIRLAGAYVVANVYIFYTLGITISCLSLIYDQA